MQEESESAKYFEPHNLCICTALVTMSYFQETTIHMKPADLVQRSVNPFLHETAFEN